MPAEWFAFGSTLPCELCGIHFACSAVRPATAVFMGVNHSALSWLLWRSANSAERNVAGLGDGDGEDVCATKVTLAVTRSTTLRANTRCITRIVTMAAPAGTLKYR